VDRASQKVVPVGQKLRETMAGILRSLLRDLLWFSACRRYPVQRPVSGGSKQNRAVPIPRSAARSGRVGQRLHGTTFHIDSFHCLMREKSD
jgi:hypothetical protein